MKRFLTLTTLLCCAFSYAQTKHTASNYESIESVAKIYRFSPADILKLNPGVKDGIQKGTTINQHSSYQSETLKHPASCRVHLSRGTT